MTDKSLNFKPACLNHATGSSTPTGFDKCAVTVLVEGNLQFLLGVHHDGAVPGHGFAYGFPRYEQEADGLSLRRNRDLVAVVEEDRCSVVDISVALHVEIVFPQGVVGKGILLVTEDALSPDHVGEYGMAARGLMDELGACGKRDVEIFRVDDDVRDRTLLPLHGPADDLDL